MEELWYGDRATHRVARRLLAPASWLYGAIVGLRAALYDRGLFRTRSSALPALSIGNLSVGGTGKTPIAAWVAGWLRARGGHPAIVMRGYGGDEPLVHAELNPDVPVVTDADRVAGVQRARTLGADCAVLDDAFQHRRIARVADWVLVSAEQWRHGQSLLPAGPLREPEDSLRRATLIVVTRKSASASQAEWVAVQLAARAPGVPVATVRLAASDLVELGTGRRAPLQSLRGRRVLAVLAIASPDALVAQLRDAGAEVSPLVFGDHHRFTPADVAQIAGVAPQHDHVVCTLKDAVKLAPLWRGVDAPLWYVSQYAAIEKGLPAVEASLESILRARTHS